MKRKLILLIVTLVIVAAAVLFLKNKEKKLDNLTKPHTPPPSVQVAPVTRGTL